MKLSHGQYDGIILSKAGLELVQGHVITEVMDQKFLPAACQGAVGVQSRMKDDLADFSNLLTTLQHRLNVLLNEIY